MGETVVEFKQAESERGRVIRHSDDEVNLALKLIVLNGGRLKNAAEQLQDEGFAIHRNTLRDWRDKAFPRRFAQIRHELAPQVTEDIAARSLERALEADAAEQEYIKAAVDRLGEVDATHLAKNALALANAKANNIHSAQLLRDKPTQIVETRNPEEMVAVLERLGVAERDKPKQVENEADDAGS